MIYLISAVIIFVILEKIWHGAKEERLNKIRGFNAEMARRGSMVRLPVE